MKIFTNEFIDAIENLEKDLTLAVSNWSKKVNNDFMIECRNLSDGDLDEFDNGFTVELESYGINCSEEIKSLYIKSIEEVSNSLCKRLETTLQDFVENKIKTYPGNVDRISNIRKMVKVVVDSDILIHYFGDANILFKFGIGIDDSNDLKVNNNWVIKYI